MSINKDGFQIYWQRNPTNKVNVKLMLHTVPAFTADHNIIQVCDKEFPLLNTFSFPKIMDVTEPAKICIKIC